MLVSLLFDLHTCIGCIVFLIVFIIVFYFAILALLTTVHRDIILVYFFHKDLLGIPDFEVYGLNSGLDHLFSITKIRSLHGLYIFQYCDEYLRTRSRMLPVVAFCLDTKRRPECW